MDVIVACALVSVLYIITSEDYPPDAAKKIISETKTRERYSTDVSYQNQVLNRLCKLKRVSRAFRNLHDQKAETISYGTGILQTDGENFKEETAQDPVAPTLPRPEKIRLRENDTSDVIFQNCVLKQLDTILCSLNKLDRRFPRII